MTYAAAKEWVWEHQDDDPFDETELHAAFIALYGHAPDPEETEDNIWALCCRRALPTEY